MCGIFGYIGKNKDVNTLVFNGLKKLEYRGYDSWGIAYGKNNQIVVDKHVGKIGSAKVRPIDSTIGMGHTRWATHGGVTIENAHPHINSDHTIALLHNGIIENFQHLRKNNIDKDYKFKSETDSEVALALLDKLSKELDFEEAFKNMFKQLAGLNAIVVLNIKENKIYAAKTGSPLVIGKAIDGIYIASDATGIVDFTNQLLFLEDNQMVSIDEHNNLSLFDLEKDKEIKAKFEEIDWKIEDVDLGKYDHFMIKEIHDQPKVIKSIITTSKPEIINLTQVIKQSKGTFFIGAGTAFNACLAGSYLFSKISKMHVNTQTASEFNYLEDFLTDKSLIIALSQSGETIDVVEPLTRAKKKGSKIVGIVNNLGSTIYRMSDYKLLLGAGPEKAVASTKAYVAKQVILFMLAYSMVDRLDEACSILDDCALEIERLLENKSLYEIEKIADLLINKKHIFTIGRGPSYATALESALKIKEVSYIHTEGLAGGELKHGTIALITDGTPCIVFAPNNDTYDAIISNAMEIKARGARIIGVSFKDSEVFDNYIEVRDTKDEGLITQIVPMQVLAYLLALKKGNDPDKPRNLAKSVVVK